MGYIDKVRSRKVFSNSGSIGSSSSGIGLYGLGSLFNIWYLNRDVSLEIVFLSLELMEGILVESENFEISRI